MKRGEVVRFKRSYVEELLPRYTSRANYLDIKAFFDGHRRVKRLAHGLLGTMAFLDCPRALHIESGDWTVYDEHLILVSPAPPKERCKGCEWVKCGSKTK